MSGSTFVYNYAKNMGYMSASASSQDGTRYSESVAAAEVEFFDVEYGL